ncbi:MAG: hypothetical protein WD032_01140 [Nitrospirales bacterium]
MMKNWLLTLPCALVTWLIILNVGGAWALTSEPVQADGDESLIGAPLPPPPVRSGQLWDGSKRGEWENRLFDTPLSHYNFSQSRERSSSGSGISLKSPGKLPGIEFGVEMHSFQALQSVVPPEILSKSLNREQNQPLLLSPSNISPDYNGGFFRFTW